MSEYIVDYDDIKEDIHVYMLDKIVRCKDCKYMHEWDMASMFGTYKIYECEYWADSTWGSREIELDGFCSWGELKAVE